jgi:hypothetical protein
MNDPDAIEAGLERNRSGLATALDELTQRASVDYIAREALGMLKVNTADATQSLDRAIRANPAAFALVGIGLAWMILGGRSQDGEGRAGWSGHDAQAGGLHADDPNPDWHSHLGALRGKARAALDQIDHEARSSVQSLKSTIADQVGQVRDFAAERAQVVESFAADMKEAVADGLDHLSASARAAVMQARQESYAALLRAERVVKGGTRKAVAVIEEHPVAVGAAALAVGAVAGIALMRSGDADRNDPAHRTRGTDRHDGIRGGAHRGALPQGAGGMVSTGGAGHPSGSGASGGPSGPRGGRDGEGTLPPA